MNHKSSVIKLAQILKSRRKPGLQYDFNLTGSEPDKYFNLIDFIPDFNKHILLNITAVKTYIVDSGFRPWTFVKIETSDAGLVGWGDCTDWGSPNPVTATVERYSEWVIVRDPMSVEAIWWDLKRRQMGRATYFPCIDTRNQLAWNLQYAHKKPMLWYFPKGTNS